MKELFQHAAITDGVTVRVAVNFLPEQSRVEAGKWFWVYHIRIENESDQPVQLVTRHWRITDGRGRTQEVRGDGVVGKQPVLGPGEVFEYTSGTPLDTPSGIMHGTFHMVVSPGGEAFDVGVPAFSLDSPHQEMRFH